MIWITLFGTALGRIVTASVIAALALGCIWLVDEIGDRRETSVRREIAAEQMAERDDAEKRIAQAAQEWREKYEQAIGDRAGLVGEITAGLQTQTACELPEDVRAKLNRIRPRGLP